VTDSYIPTIKPYLIRAKRLSMSSEEEAYFLGSILRDAVKHKELDQYYESIIHELVKKFDFLEYYEHRRKPDFDSLPIVFTLVMVALGLMAVIAGVRMLWNNEFIVSANNTRPLGSFVSGGAILVFGLIFLIGGSLKTLQQLNRNIYLKQLAK